MSSTVECTCYARCHGSKYISTTAWNEHEEYRAQDARAEADQLTRAIRGARRGPPMRPLSPVAPSTKPMSAEEARMQEVQSACARLAEQLGVCKRRSEVEAAAADKVRSLRPPLFLLFAC